MGGTLRFLKGSLCILLLVFILSACLAREQTLKISDPGKYHFLIIQKVEGNRTSEELSKIVKDDQLISSLLKEVDGLKVKKVAGKKLFNIVKVADESYSFFFDTSRSDGMKRLHPSYDITMLDDGTFIFTNLNDEGNAATYLAAEKHPKLVKKLKRLSAISF